MAASELYEENSKKIPTPKISNRKCIQKPIFSIVITIAIQLQFSVCLAGIVCSNSTMETLKRCLNLCTSFWCLYRKLRGSFTLFSAVFIVEFQQVNGGWELPSA